ncbi:type III-B CRISPR system CMR subunit Cmr7 [Saccharolobus shibatae]|uniref:Uncharacterized protein n=1 Tax=Saccharolobus shibatae TaxID=2286 RepID=A0A8F5GW66_9CREN|nr:type III-B CRISPR system CMR subunit Cmr7 [Saccharolobus shibatae]QXJ31858.1 hypothetical protein J5U21_01509 [Saccharolobus shibatae]
MTEIYYVFVPLLNNVNYNLSDKENEGKNFSVKHSSTGKEIKIELTDKLTENNHISRIEEKDKNGKKYVEIHNILVLTGYAIDENSLELVPTLDPCDYVKGILIAGKIQEEIDKKAMSITFPKDEVMNKLYFIKKSKVKLQDQVTIKLIIAENKKVVKTKYNSLNIDEHKIQGIKDLYGITDANAVNDLKIKLEEIISYYSIGS